MQDRSGRPRAGNEIPHGEGFTPRICDLFGVQCRNEAITLQNKGRFRMEMLQLEMQQNEDHKKHSFRISPGGAQSESQKDCTAVPALG